MFLSTGHFMGRLASWHISQRTLRAMEGGILVWEDKNLIKIFTCVYVNKKVCAPFFDLVHPFIHHQVRDNL